MASPKRLAQEDLPKGNSPPTKKRCTDNGGSDNSPPTKKQCTARGPVVSIHNNGGSDNHTFDWYLVPLAVVTADFCGRVVDETTAITEEDEKKACAMLSSVNKWHMEDTAMCSRSEEAESCSICRCYHQLIFKLTGWDYETDKEIVPADYDKYRHSETEVPSDMDIRYQFVVNSIEI